MGFFIKEHLRLEGSFILKFVPPIFLICLIDKGSYPGLQADDMTVYNDELENRKLIGYCRKEKRKTGLVFLHIIFIRIKLIFPSRVKKNWSQCMGLFTCCSYGKALQHYTCKYSGHGLECH